MVKNGIKELKHWLEKRGYTVNLRSNTNVIDSEMKIVRICAAKQLHVLYSLAHEAGHEVLFSRKNYNTKFKSVRRAEDQDARHNKSRLYRFKKLEEEIMAWNEGYKLLIRLGIKLNRQSYDEYAAKYVNTYIQSFSA